LSPPSSLIRPEIQGASLEVFRSTARLDSASTGEPVFLPFSATSEYDCSGSSFRLPPIREPHPASRTPRPRLEGYRPPRVACEEATRLAPKREDTRKPVPGIHRSNRSRTRCAARHGGLATRRSEPTRAPRTRAARRERRGRSVRSAHVLIPATEATVPTHGASPGKLRLFTRSKRTHDPRVQCGSSAVSPPRQRDLRLSTRHRSGTSSIRLVRLMRTGDGRASTSVPFGTHVRRRCAVPRWLSSPRTRKVSEAPHVSTAEAAITSTPALTRLSQRQKPSPLRALGSSVRASGQENATSDKHDTATSTRRQTRARVRAHR
jgi:hypothetical protein